MRQVESSSEEDNNVSHANRPTVVRHIPSREDLIKKFSFKIPQIPLNYQDITVSTKRYLEDNREDFSQKIRGYSEEVP